MLLGVTLCRRRNTGSHDELAFTLHSLLLERNARSIIASRGNEKNTLGDTEETRESYLLTNTLIVVFDPKAWHGVTLDPSLITAYHMKCNVSDCGNFKSFRT